MDIRKTILTELKRQDKSRYWLGKSVAQAGAANRETVFRYLRGHRDTSGSVIGVILDVLGLRIDANGKPAATAAPAAKARPAPAAKARRRAAARR